MCLANRARSRTLAGVMVSTQAQNAKDKINAKDVGSISGLGTIFPIFITSTTNIYIKPSGAIDTGPHPTEASWADMVPLVQRCV